MHKFWLVARNEYLRSVQRRSFLIATVGMPLLVILLMGVSILASTSGSGDAADLGYVDKSGVLAGNVENPGLRAFADTEAALSALGFGQITGFYVLPEDYRSTGRVDLYYWQRPPGQQLQNAFDSFVEANLVAGLPTEVARRVVDGPSTFVVRSADGQRQMDSKGIINIILPFALGIFISFALVNAASYLLQAVTDEKESRTIEIVTTAVSPERLIAGKGVGLVGVALTQVLLWGLVVVVGVTVAANWVEELQGMQLSWALVLVLAAYFPPLYALATGTVVTLGVAVSDFRQGQQVVGVFTLLFLLPLFFTPLLMSDPDGSAMVALTLFPTTSLLTVALRWSATVIPWWQLLAGWVILAGCAAATLWATPRIFRRGMLRYGQRMGLRNVLAALRGGAPAR